MPRKLRLGLIFLCVLPPLGLLQCGSAASARKAEGTIRTGPKAECCSTAAIWLDEPCTAPKLKDEVKSVKLESVH